MPDDNLHAKTNISINSTQFSQKEKRSRQNSGNYVEYKSQKVET